VITGRVAVDARGRKPSHTNLFHENVFDLIGPGHLVFVLCKENDGTRVKFLDGILHFVL